MKITLVVNVSDVEAALFNPEVEACALDIFGRYFNEAQIEITDIDGMSGTLWKLRKREQQTLFELDQIHTQIQEVVQREYMLPPIDKSAVLKAIQKFPNPW